MAVQKRGKNSWLIKIYRGRGPDGKKKFYTETFYAPIKSMALARERELKVQLSHIGTNKNITFLEEWLDRWLQKIQNDVAPRTWREYASIVKRLKPVVGNLRLYTLNAEEMLRLLDAEFRNLKPKTRKNIYSTLKTAVKAAIECKLVPADALQGFKVPRVPKQEKTVLTREQLTRIVAIAPEYRHGLIIHLLCHTGARVGEILGLTWNSINFEKKTITIDQSVDVKTRQFKAEVKTANSRRTIEIDNATIELLKKHKQNQAEKVTPIDRSSRLVFSVNGKPVRYNAVRKTWLRILNRAGLQELNLHAIRHSVITLLLEEGTPPIPVAGMVGHNVATTVSTYAQKIQGGKAITLTDQQMDQQSI